MATNNPTSKITLPYHKTSILIDAPVEIIWSLLTVANLLEKWWWVPPITGKVKVVNPIPAKYFQYQVQSTNSQPAIRTFVYLEVIPHQRLVLTTALNSKLQPTISLNALTIIINLRDTAKGVYFEPTAIFKSKESMDTHLNNGFYSTWLNNLGVMHKIALQLKANVLAQANLLAKAKAVLRSQP